MSYRAKSLLIPSLALGLLLGLSSRAFAASEQLTNDREGAGFDRALAVNGVLKIIADSVERNPVDGPVVASGNAVAVINGEHASINADSITYDCNNEMMSAVGNVKIVRNNVLTLGSSFKFKIRSDEYLVTSSSTILKAVIFQSRATPNQSMQVKLTDKVTPADRMPHRLYSNGFLSFANLNNRLDLIRFRGRGWIIKLPITSLSWPESNELNGGNFFLTSEDRITVNQYILGDLQRKRYALGNEIIDKKPFSSYVSSFPPLPKIGSHPIFENSDFWIRLQIMPVRRDHYCDFPLPSPSFITKYGQSKNAHTKS